MTRTLSMSVRRGTGLLPGAISTHQIQEAVEQVAGVVRAGRGLGVVLHRERRRVEEVEALDDVVVEADVADLRATERRAHGAVARRVDGEPVVVRGDLDAAGAPVHDRLVDAPVPVAELV